MKPFYRELTAEEHLRLLTQSQVDALPEGIVVMIRWIGGNGPHPYRVRKCEGKSFAGSYHFPDDPTDARSLIEYVDSKTESCRTQVFLPDETTEIDD